MSLDDDIARIAALRGRKLEDVHEAERQRRRVSAADVRTVFTIYALPEREMAAFDQLPPASRRALAALPFCASALQYRYLLTRLDETTLIGAVQAEAAVLEKR